MLITLNRDRDDKSIYHLAVNANEIFVGTQSEVFALLEDTENLKKIAKESANGTNLTQKNLAEKLSRDCRR